MEENIIAIVPAAGLGKRFDSSRRKTFVHVDEIPLLAHTLLRLHIEELITEIIPVLRDEDIEYGRELASEYELNKVRKIATGGQERQDSVYNALKMIDNDQLVLIHDGVRPVIPEGTINNLVKGLEGVDGVIPGRPSKDTLKEVDNEGLVVSTMNRQKIRAIQTPQLFRYDLIRRAYDLAYEKGLHATDDAALVEDMGGKIRVIAGSPYNIKVTVPADMDMVEFFLMKERQDR
jgi:2-C-methyl-D-erythritol 4-phosphate cytidylyltransferase